MLSKQHKYVLIPVDLCEDGSILGEDVFTESGKLVLSEGTILTAELIEKLIALGIFTVSIQAQLGLDESNNIYVNDNHKEVIEKAYQTLDTIMGMLANRKPVSIKNHEQELQDLLQSTISTGEIIDILRQVQAFDDYLYKHSLAVGIYSVMLAAWLKLDDKDIKNVGLAGILHDIGKTKIDKELLSKPNSLTGRQQEILERHVRFSHDIVKFCGFHDSGMLKAILQHHERIDGSGYPERIKGNLIHPFAHIVAVADRYHNLTTDQPDKKRINHTEALKALRKEAFTCLDAKTVLTFIDGMMGKYSGRFCKMSNGQSGKVVFINRDDPIYPIIKIGKGAESKYIDLRFEKNLSIHEIL
ncbi:HD-GYP domain-containing protein [Desulfuribacillus alkaliarsenatis]|uniref:HD-GYP domain-containing protein n=1 Tax=Desulfuribacillus alkaliarsenatis TaxID=766136 RepID=A0A1E5G0I1_9FIRM|nr:HD-GYP domain-containing protein [Desulfuribacillus alkaliarsenatis]OEF96341.1 hypothetical protein BHF68_09330 [Desulfuribacillus alkaliarsenatis]